MTHPSSVRIRGTPMPELHAETRVRHNRTHLASDWSSMEFGVFLCFPSLEDTVIFKLFSCQNVFSAVQFPFRFIVSNIH